MLAPDPQRWPPHGATIRLQGWVVTTQCREMREQSMTDLQVIDGLILKLLQVQLATTVQRSTQWGRLHLYALFGWRLTGQPQQIRRDGKLTMATVSACVHHCRR